MNGQVAKEPLPELKISNDECELELSFRPITFEQGKCGV
mgnify:CR=1 FL=1